MLNEKEDLAQQRQKNNMEQLELPSMNCTSCKDAMKKLMSDQGIVILGPTIEELFSTEMEQSIKKLYDEHPELTIDKIIKEKIRGVDSLYHPDDPWIQTYTGRRFNPTNPIVDAICIEDIAHALSMQCRFSGHCSSFYSVANHCILVSYICDSKDALHGLLHDSSEAYLVDIPRPIKRSGKFDNYLAFETKMEKAIAKRFGLSDKMPASVKLADDILLATEARDLMGPLHPSWEQPADPLPFTIKPLSQAESKHLFIKRFYELTTD